MKFHRTDTLFIYVIKRSTDDKDEDWFIGNSNDYNNWKKKLIKDKLEEITLKHI